MSAVYKVGYETIETVMIYGAEKPHRVYGAERCSMEEELTVDEALKEFAVVRSGSATHTDTVIADNATEAIAKVCAAKIGETLHVTQDDHAGIPEIERGAMLCQEIVNVVIVRVEPIAFTTI